MNMVQLRSVLSSQDSPEQLETASSILVLQYSCLAAIVLYCYDYFLTFSLEVDVIWGRKLTWNMALLLLNKYGTLFAYIPTSILLFGHRGQFGVNIGCHPIARFPGVISALSRAVVIYFSIIRALAIYGRSIRLTCILVPFGLATAAVSAWALLQLETSFSLGNGLKVNHVCFPLLQKTVPFIIAWSCFTAFNAFVFGLVIIKTVRLRWEYCRMGIPGESRLVTKLMRHETMFFSLILAINTFSLLQLTFQSEPSLKGVSGRNGEIVHSVSAALLSRMVFSLKQEGIDVNANVERTLSSIHFQGRDTSVLQGTSSGQVLQAEVF